ncbi:hypothetical protein SprV_0501751100 [Sparganum proliferum]
MDQHSHQSVHPLWWLLPLLLLSLELTGSYAVGTSCPASFSKEVCRNGTRVRIDAIYEPVAPGKCERRLTSHVLPDLECPPPRRLEATPCVDGQTTEVTEAYQLLDCKCTKILRTQQKPCPCKPCEVIRKECDPTTHSLAIITKCYLHTAEGECKPDLKVTYEPCGSCPRDVKRESSCYAQTHTLFTRVTSYRLDRDETSGRAFCQPVVRIERSPSPPCPPPNATRGEPQYTCDYRTCERSASTMEWQLDGCQCKQISLRRPVGFCCCPKPQSEVSECIDRSRTVRHIFFELFNGQCQRHVTVSEEACGDLSSKDSFNCDETTGMKTFTTARWQHLPSGGSVETIQIRRIPTLCQGVEVVSVSKCKEEPGSNRRFRNILIITRAREGCECGPPVTRIITEACSCEDVDSGEVVEAGAQMKVQTGCRPECKPGSEICGSLQCKNIQQWFKMEFINEEEDYASAKNVTRLPRCRRSLIRREVSDCCCPTTPVIKRECDASGKRWLMKKTESYFDSGLCSQSVVTWSEPVNCSNGFVGREIGERRPDGMQEVRLIFEAIEECRCERYLQRIDCPWPCPPVERGPVRCNQATNRIEEKVKHWILIGGRCQPIEDVIEKPTVCSDEANVENSTAATRLVCNEKTGWGQLTRPIWSVENCRCVRNVKVLREGPCRCPRPEEVISPCNTTLRQQKVTKITYIAEDCGCKRTEQTSILPCGCPPSTEIISSPPRCDPERSEHVVETRRKEWRDSLRACVEVKQTLRIPVGCPAGRQEVEVCRDGKRVSEIRTLVFDNFECKQKVEYLAKEQDCHKAPEIKAGDCDPQTCKRNIYEISWNRGRNDCRCQPVQRAINEEDCSCPEGEKTTSPCNPSTCQQEVTETRYLAVNASCVRLPPVKSLQFCCCRQGEVPYSVRRECDAESGLLIEVHTFGRFDKNLRQCVPATQRRVIQPPDCEEKRHVKRGICNKLTGFATDVLFKNQFNKASCSCEMVKKLVPRKCVCPMPVSSELDCDPRTCMATVQTTSYIPEHCKCVPRLSTQSVQCCCPRDHRSTHCLENGTLAVQRLIKFRLDRENRRCEKSVHIEKKEIACDTNAVVELQRSCHEASCHPVSLMLQNRLEHCRCVQKRLKVLHKDKYCCCPPPRTALQCFRETGVLQKTTHQYELVDEKCVERKDVLQERISCPDEKTVHGSCDPLTKRRLVTRTFYVIEDCKCVQKVDRAAELCDCPQEYTEKRCAGDGRFELRTTTFRLVERDGGPLTCVREDKVTVVPVTCPTTAPAKVTVTECLRNKRNVTTFRHVLDPVSCSCLVREETRVEACDCEKKNFRNVACIGNALVVSIGEFSSRPGDRHCTIKASQKTEPIDCPRNEETVNSGAGCTVEREGGLYRAEIMRWQEVDNCRCVPRQKVTHRLCSCQKPQTLEICEDNSKLIIESLVFNRVEDRCMPNHQIVNKEIRCEQPTRIVGTSACVKSQPSSNSKVRCEETITVEEQTVQNCKCVKRLRTFKRRCCAPPPVVRRVCDRSTGQWLTTTHKYKLTESKLLYSAENVEIWDRDVSVVTDTTAEQVVCPEPEVSEQCDKVTGVWTKTVTEHKRDGCTCKATKVSHTGHCSCPETQVVTGDCDRDPRSPRRGMRIKTVTSFVPQGCKCTQKSEKLLEVCDCQAKFGDSVVTKCLGDEEVEEATKRWSLVDGKCEPKVKISRRIVGCPKNLTVTQCMPGGKVLLRTHTSFALARKPGGVECLKEVTQARLDPCVGQAKGEMVKPSACNPTTCQRLIEVTTSVPENCKCVTKRTQRTETCCCPPPTEPKLTCNQVENILTKEVRVHQLLSALPIGDRMRQVEPFCDTQLVTTKVKVSCADQKPKIMMTSCKANFRTVKVIVSVPVNCTCVEQVAQVSRMRCVCPRPQTRVSECGAAGKPFAATETITNWTAIDCVCMPKVQQRDFICDCGAKFPPQTKRECKLDSLVEVEVTRWSLQGRKCVPDVTKSSSRIICEDQLKPSKGSCDAATRRREIHWLKQIPINCECQWKPMPVEEVKRRGLKLSEACACPEPRTESVCRPGGSVKRLADGSTLAHQVLELRTIRFSLVDGECRGLTESTVRNVTCAIGTRYIRTECDALTRTNQEIRVTGSLEGCQCRKVSARRTCQCACPAPKETTECDPRGGVLRVVRETYQLDADKCSCVASTHVSEKQIDCPEDIAFERSTGPCAPKPNATGEEVGDMFRLVTWKTVSRDGCKCVQRNHRLTELCGCPEAKKLTHCNETTGIATTTKLQPVIENCECKSAVQTYQTRCKCNLQTSFVRQTACSKDCKITIIQQREKLTSDGVCKPELIAQVKKCCCPPPTVIRRSCDSSNGMSSITTRSFKLVQGECIPVDQTTTQATQCPKVSRRTQCVELSDQQQAWKTVLVMWKSSTKQSACSRREIFTKLQPVVCSIPPQNISDCYFDAKRHAFVRRILNFKTRLEGCHCVSEPPAVTFQVCSCAKPIRRVKCENCLNENTQVETSISYVRQPDGSCGRQQKIRRLPVECKLPANLQLSGREYTVRLSANGTVVEHVYACGSSCLRKVLTASVSGPRNCKCAVLWQESTEACCCHGPSTKSLAVATTEAAVTQPNRIWRDCSGPNAMLIRHQRRWYLQNGICRTFTFTHAEPLVCITLSKAEVVFLVDESVSSRIDGYSLRVRELLKHTIRTFKSDRPDGNGTDYRFAVVKYASSPSIAFNLDDYDVSPPMLHHVDNLHYEGRLSNLGRALDLTNREVLSRSRKDIAKMIYLISDGVNDISAAPDMAAALRASGVQINVLAFGSDKRGHIFLSKLASEPKQRHFVVLRTRQQTKELSDWLIQTLCLRACPPNKVTRGACSRKTNCVGYIYSHVYQYSPVHGRCLGTTRRRAYECCCPQEPRSNTRCVNGRLINTKEVWRLRINKLGIPACHQFKLEKDVTPILEKVCSEPKVFATKCDSLTCQRRVVFVEERAHQCKCVRSLKAMRETCCCPAREPIKRTSCAHDDTKLLAVAKTGFVNSLRTCLTTEEFTYETVACPTEPIITRSSCRATQASEETALRSEGAARLDPHLLYRRVTIEQAQLTNCQCTRRRHSVFEVCGCREPERRLVRRCHQKQGILVTYEQNYQLTVVEDNQTYVGGKALGRRVSSLLQAHCRPTFSAQIVTRTVCPDSNILTGPCVRSGGDEGRAYRRVEFEEWQREGCECKKAAPRVVRKLCGCRKNVWYRQECRKTEAQPGGVLVIHRIREKLASQSGKELPVCKVEVRKSVRKIECPPPRARYTNCVNGTLWVTVELVTLRDCKCETSRFRRPLKCMQFNRAGERTDGGEPLLPRLRHPYDGNNTDRLPSRLMDGQWRRSMEALRQRLQELGLSNVKAWPGDAQKLLGAGPAVVPKAGMFAPPAGLAGPMPQLPSEAKKFPQGHQQSLLSHLPQMLFKGLKVPAAVPSPLGRVQRPSSGRARRPGLLLFNDLPKGPLPQRSRSREETTKRPITQTIHSQPSISPPTVLPSVPESLNFVQCADILPSEKCLQLERKPHSSCDKPGQIRDHLCRQTCRTCQDCPLNRTDFEVVHAEEGANACLLTDLRLDRRYFIRLLKEVGFVECRRACASEPHCLSFDFYVPSVNRENDFKQPKVVPGSCVLNRVDLRTLRRRTLPELVPVGATPEALKAHGAARCLLFRRVCLEDCELPKLRYTSPCECEQMKSSYPFAEEILTGSEPKSGRMHCTRKATLVTQVHGTDGKCQQRTRHLSVVCQPTQRDQLQQLLNTHRLHSTNESRNLCVDQRPTNWCEESARVGGCKDALVKKVCAGTCGVCICKRGHTYYGKCQSTGRMTVLRVQYKYDRDHGRCVASKEAKTVVCDRCPVGNFELVTPCDKASKKRQLIRISAVVSSAKTSAKPPSCRFKLRKQELDCHGCTFADGEGAERQSISACQLTANNKFRLAVRKEYMVNNSGCCEIRRSYRLFPCKGCPKAHSTTSKCVDNFRLRRIVFYTRPSTGKFSDDKHPIPASLCLRHVIVEKESCIQQLEETKDCTDLIGRAGCEEFKHLNHCTTRPHAARVLCAKACGLC